MPTNGNKRTIGVGYAISVVFFSMLAHALPASLPVSTSSPQEEAGNMTGEMHPAHQPDTARNSHGVNTTLTNKVDRQEVATLNIVDVKTESHAHHTSNISTSKPSEANITGYFLTNQNVRTAKEHSPNSQLAATAHADGFHTKGQSPSIHDTSTAQTDATQTIESPDPSPVSADWIPHCEDIERTPSSTSKASNCPPSTQLSEQLKGKVEWGFDSIECRQEIVILHIRVPTDYGFVVEFHLVHVKRGNALTIYHVGKSESPSSFGMFCSPAQTLTAEWLDYSPLRQPLSPLMLHTNNMQLVVRSVNGWRGLMINVSYTAHPLSSIPYSTQVSEDEPTETRYMYHCDGMTNLPEAISCDGIRHCEHGEDEENCTYRDEGCGDWYPLNDKCIKVIFMRMPEHEPFETSPTAPAEAEETCQQEHAATLAAFPDSASQEAMADMIRKSGFTNAVVGIRKVQTVSPLLYHWYQFMWQWGTQGSPIAYEQQELQIEGVGVGCAQLDIHPWPHLRPIQCALPDFPPDGFICMRPNPFRSEGKLTLPGIAFPVASSAPDAFITKTCPDGSVVQIFHSCWWEGHNEGRKKDDIADGLSPNNFSLFQCTNGETIHYSFLCDGHIDCEDASDLDNCEGPRFSALLNSSFICRDYTAVPRERRCNGMQDCFEGSDEYNCFSCSGTILCSQECYPKHYLHLSKLCPGHKYTPLTSKPYNPARVVLDGYGMSRLEPVSHHCDEGFYQCQGGFCIPTFLFNNGEQDCPKGEDEDIPVYNMTCPGYYRCNEVGTCVHKMYVCDNIHHCPFKDDELYCNLTCPHDSGCVCEGHAYKCSKMINPLDNLHVRYLDLSFAANVSLDNVHFMEYLAFLNLSFCRLVDVTMRDMPQLRTLDLSSNLLTRLSSLSFVALPGVTYLDLSHNPLVKTLSAEFSAMLLTAELQNLRILKLVNVSLDAVDRMAFSPLTKLEHLDIRANQLRRYNKESLHGLVSLEELYTDEPKLCCPYFQPSVSRCNAPEDELSSCSDLLSTAIYRVCLWALAVLALVGNCGVLFYRFLLLVRTRTPLSAASILVKNLCASDLLMGVYLAMIGVADAQLSGTYVAREREWRSSVMCTVAGVLSLVSSEVSALVICLITLDRVLVLCFPFKPEFHLTPRVTVMSCLGVWVAGVVLATIPLLIGLEFYGQSGICIPLPLTRQQFSGQYFAFGVFIVFNFVIFLLIGAGQLMIYQAVRKVSAAAGAATRSRDTTVARRLFLIVLTDFCCWFPVGVMGLLAALGTPIPGEVNVWAAIFVLPLNSALNPFLYTLSALLERLRQQRVERKIKKIVGTLKNEIPKWNAATVQDVTRICVSSGLVEKDAVDTMFAARVWPLTNKPDCADVMDTAGCHNDSVEISNTAFGSGSCDLMQTTQADVTVVCDSNE